MKWLIQSIKLQLSVISTHFYTRHEETNLRLVHLFIIGNILFVLLHPESAVFGILGVLLAWKYCKAGKFTEF